VGALTDHLQNLNQGWLYLIVGLLVAVEYAGLLLPGETAAIVAGALSSSGHAHVSVVVLVVVAAAIAGNCVGYEIGRRFGPRLLRLRVLARYERRIGQAMAFLDRRGGMAVFLARFLSFFRSAMPILAGMARMPYRKFAVFNVAGGVIWGTTFVLLGYAAGNSYKKVESVAGRGGAMAAAVIVVGFLAFRHFRKHRSEQAAEARPEQGSGIR
jgi:membrane protein DedA with SNARE-associated domain